MAKIRQDETLNMALPLNIKRGNSIPLDTTAVWYDKTELEAYAKSGATAYVGQVLTLVADSKCEAYMISNEAGDLIKLEPNSISDWQQNDQNSIDYIKNRPGGYEVLDKFEISETMGAAGAQTMLAGFIPEEFLKEGQEFTIIINGEESTYTAATVSGMDGTFQIGTFTYTDFAAGNLPENGYIFALGGVATTDNGNFACVSLGSYANKEFKLSINKTEIVKIPSKYLESPDIIVKLSENDGTFSQTTSYTSAELIKAFDSGMNIRAAVSLPGQSLLLPCIARLVDSDMSQLLWAAEDVLVLMQAQSSGEVEWMLASDDSINNRFSVVEWRLDYAESRLDTAESSITAAQTTADEAKAAANWSACANYIVGV